MTDLNEICVSGTLTRDPVLKRTKSDQDMCNFQLAVSRPEPSRAHDYLDVVFWGEKAAAFAKGYSAGERLMIKGRLKKSEYIGTDGRKRVMTQIVAEYVHPCDSPGMISSELLSQEAMTAESMA